MREAPLKQLATDADLRAKYMRMRTSGATRPELSRQACADLFALGRMPTARTVRELTEIGSLSDLSKDVQNYWNEVRRTTLKRVKADLPESVLDLASRLATEIFEHAVERTEETMSALEHELTQARSDLTLAHERHLRITAEKQALADANARLQFQVHEQFRRLQELQGICASQK